MQDRFKFRSYGKPNSIIEGMQNIYTFEEIEGGYFNVKVDKGWLSFVKEEDLKIMQCTGLKDKNGKLIYEGDIVKISPSGFFDNNRDVFCIKFTDGYRLAYQDWQTLDTIGGFSNKLFEIIGNIYETPELLKDGE